MPEHQYAQHDHDDLSYDDDGWSVPHHHGRGEHFHIRDGPAIYAHDIGYLHYAADAAFVDWFKRPAPDEPIGCGGNDIDRRTSPTPPGCRRRGLTPPSSSSPPPSSSWRGVRWCSASRDEHERGHA